MRKLVKIIAILLVAILLMMPVIQVYAIDDPDDPPEVNSVYVYVDLLEEGDAGVLIDYYIDYTIAGVPDEVVTEAYLASFIDTDGTTQLGTVAPYAYHNSGYDRGLVWIYFTAAEVTTHGIAKANEALYTVWLMGNPTVESGWTGDPPKTIATLDYFQDSGVTSTLVALRVLYYADLLELAWAVDLVEETTLGSRLTALGEAYFPNVISSLRVIAPNCFSVSTYEQIQEDLDYSTTFGAVIEDGTGTLAVSPTTLAEGENNVAITGAGTFIVTLEKGTVGTAESIAGGCTVVGSPADLVYGENTITTNLAGTNDILVDVNLVNTAETLEDTVIGGVFDLTDLAAEFGMTRWMLSGLVWLGCSILICGAAYKMGSRQFGSNTSIGKGVLLLFNVCIVGGTMLGLLHMVVAILLFLGFGFLTAYVLFFRSASF